VVKALATGPGRPRFKHTACISAGLFTHQSIGICLSSELEKVGAMRKRDGVSPQLHYSQYKLTL